MWFQHTAFQADLDCNPICIKKTKEGSEELSTWNEELKKMEKDMDKLIAQEVSKNQCAFITKQCSGKSGGGSSQHLGPLLQPQGTEAAELLAEAKAEADGRKEDHSGGAGKCPFLPATPQLYRAFGDTTAGVAAGMGCPFHQADKTGVKNLLQQVCADVPRSIVAEFVENVVPIVIHSCALDECRSL